jgi:hypothetical protein
MLGFVAAVVFAVAFVINAFSISVDAIFTPMSLLLVGLALLALHLSGVGPEASIRRSRGRSRR